METIAESFFAQSFTIRLIISVGAIGGFFLAAKLLKSFMKAVFLVSVVAGVLMTYNFVTG